jgi:hypothetical protein
VGRQAAQSRPIGPNKPEVGSSFVRFEVRFPHDEDNPLAIRGNLLIGNSIQRQHIVDRKRMSLVAGTGTNKQK